VWIDTCCIDKKSSAELTNQSIRCSDGMRTAQSATYIFPMSCGIAEPRGILESSSSGAVTIFDEPEARHATAKDDSIHSITSGVATKIFIGSCSDSVDRL
jgi:hypothetical protein